jgi:hypothetical protein
MFSNRQKLNAIAVIAIVFLAGSTILLWKTSPSVSPAEQMILDASDVPEEGWQQLGSGEHDQSGYELNETSSAYSDMETRSNVAIPVTIELSIYNNETNCHSEYLSLNRTGHLLGDEGCILTQLDDYASLVFRKANIMVFITIWSYGKSDSKLDEIAFNLAELQLQKIESHL